MEKLKLTDLLEINRDGEIKSTYGEVEPEYTLPLHYRCYLRNCEAMKIKPICLADWYRRLEDDGGPDVA